MMMMMMMMMMTEIEENTYQEFTTCSSLSLVENSGLIRFKLLLLLLSISLHAHQR